MGEKQSVPCHSGACLTQSKVQVDFNDVAMYELTSPSSSASVVPLYAAVTYSL